MSAAPPPPGSEPRRLAALLDELARADGPERISIGEIMDRLGTRAFGAILFVLAFPNAIPTGIPGLSAILGAPLIILLWQMVLGHQQPWLPERVRARNFDRAGFQRLSARTARFVARFERFVGPRMSWLTGPEGKRVLGVLGLVSAIILFLPIPFGNNLPALAIALTGIALMERDGRVAIAAMVTTGLGIALLAVLAFVFGTAISAAWLGWFG